MSKRYISVDIEASGPTPGKYSMLSIGACVVGKTSQQFYEELKPLNFNFQREAMEIGCLGLYCFKDTQHLPALNPRAKEFSPRKVLEHMKDAAEEPSQVMHKFSEWILKETVGFQPIMAAAPIVYDGMFINWYFDNFCMGGNPFGHSGEDMNSFYRGIVGDCNARMSDLQLPDNRKVPHNALEDAIQQAEWFEKVLDIIKR